MCVAKALQVAPLWTDCLRLFLAVGCLGMFRNGELRGFGLGEENKTTIDSVSILN